MVGDKVLYRKLMRTDVYLPIMGTGLATNSPGNFGFPDVSKMNLTLLGLPGEFVGWGNQSFPGPTSNDPFRTKNPHQPLIVAKGVSSIVLV